MDASRLVKWIVILAIVFVAWKYGLPWIKRQTSHTPTSAASATADDSCISVAERASQAWGSGIGRFVNPPYDIDAWATFSGNVKSNIASAESACNCSAESCIKTRDAMHDLRNLVNDLDSSIRGGGPPPSDAVQRQATIDEQLNTAHELVRAGK
jgi:hypothetical protein